MTLGIVDIATILLVTVGPLKALIVFAYAFAVVGAGAGAPVLVTALATFVIVFGICALVMRLLPQSVSQRPG